MLSGCAQPLPSGGVLGDVIYTLSHLGVPVFFLVSGYYFLDLKSEIPFNKLCKKVKHIFLLLVVHIVLYTAYAFVQTWASTGVIQQGIEEVKGILGIRVLIKAVVFGTGINGGGQWYLVSQLMAYLILGILFQTSLRKWIIKYSHVIAAFLLLIHIPVRMYLIKSGISSLHGIPLIDTWSVRNTWFDAIPFMLIGISLKVNIEFRVSHPLIISSLAAVCSVGGHFFSVKMLEPYQMSSVLYAGTVISVVMALYWAIQQVDLGRGKVLAVVGEKYSMLIFFLHPIVGWTLKEIISHFYVADLGRIVEIIFCLSVIGITTIIAMCAYKVKQSLLQ